MNHNAFGPVHRLKNARLTFWKGIILPIVSIVLAVNEASSSTCSKFAQEEM